VDRPVAERRCERLVDEPVLLDEREPVEAAARDRHLEMVAATRPVLDRKLARVRERRAQERFQRAGESHGIIVAVARLGSFLLSVPERAVRALAAGLGGAVHETAEVVLPRFSRRSRLYEATAKNLLRIVIELFGNVEREAPVGQPDATELLKRKTAGNVMELSSIAAFGFSPLWLLAAASDISHGSRVYLDVLVAELKRAGVLAEDAELRSIDDLLGALEGASGTTARLVDLPPLELSGLRSSLSELRSSASELPTPRQFAALYTGLQRTAARERQSLLEVSSGMGLAFLVSARTVGREHLVAPYREDWKPLREEGFAAYARRVSGPYRAAMSRHFDPERETWTERAKNRVRR
jgi:hypothetical protein